MLLRNVGKHVQDFTALYEVSYNTVLFIATSENLTSNSFICASIYIEIVSSNSFRY